MDCRPLYLYWQVEPDPGTRVPSSSLHSTSARFWSNDRTAGSCSQAHDQLITLGVVNIATDIMLIGLPMPSLMSVRRSFGA